MALDMATYHIQKTQASEWALMMAQEYHLSLVAGYKNENLTGSTSADYTQGLAYDFSPPSWDLAHGAENLQTFVDLAKKTKKFTKVEVDGSKVHLAWSADPKASFDPVTDINLKTKERSKNVNDYVLKGLPLFLYSIDDKMSIEEIDSNFGAIDYVPKFIVKNGGAVGIRVVVGLVGLLILGFGIMALARR